MFELIFFSGDLAPYPRAGRDYGAPSRPRLTRHPGTSRVPLLAQELRSLDLLPMFAPSAKFSAGAHASVDLSLR